ncbi:MAG: Uma2 family endonuclease [Richelia sp. CSU_2_1]|nr:Uma2 family endonuclease [Microcoleus sp. SM1_3_4]NJR23944.1 Uma2 family endonuclease [Richelia sp. CSU_2_1]
MSAQLKKRLFTVKEYHQMFELGILSKSDHVELIEGEIIQMPATGIAQARCLQQLIAIFGQLPETTASLDFKNQVQLNKQTEIKPDMVLLRFRADSCEITYIEVSEVLLLIGITECGVDNNLDIKIPIYVRSLIPEVWLLNLVENSLEVYRQPTPNGYNLILKLHRGQEIAPIGFPDFTVSVDAILPTINKSIV